MTKTGVRRPLQLPDYLKPEEMDLFMADPNVRAARREARRAKLAPPAGGVAMQGYSRDWLFQDVDTLPKPANIDRSLAGLLQAKVRLLPPITDKITSRYDIHPYKKSAEGYGIKHQRDFMNRVRRQEVDPERIAVFEQGSARSLEHTRDNLQANLWLKTQIAKWRLAYLDTAISRVSAQQAPAEDVLRHAGGAIADFGYCLRGQDGLLASIDMDITFANSVEHLGHYISLGSVDTLESNITIAETVRQEQAKRFKYWGERHHATYEAFGNRLPDEDLDAGADLDVLISALYSQDSTASPEAL